MTSAKDREEFLLEERARIDAELAELRKEPEEGEEFTPLDVTGQVYGGAYWTEAEYRVWVAREDDEEKPVVLWVEDSSGTRVDQMWFTLDEIEGITWMASTDHGLSGYEDDWKIPLGVGRSLTWTLGDENHRVVLDEGHIDEIAEWLRLTMGEDD